MLRRDHGPFAVTTWARPNARADVPATVPRVPKPLRTRGAECRRETGAGRRRGHPPGPQVVHNEIPRPADLLGTMPPSARDTRRETAPSPAPRTPTAILSPVAPSPTPAAHLEGRCHNPARPAGFPPTRSPPEGPPMALRDPCSARAFPRSALAVSASVSPRAGPSGGLAQWTVTGMHVPGGHQFACCDFERHGEPDRPASPSAPVRPWSQHDHTT